MKTRTKSFILNFTLVLAMLIGLFTIMPMTASAASDTITITGLTAPQAGQSVEEWYEDNYPSFSPGYDLDFGAWVEGEYVNWEEAGEALDNVGPFEGTFEDGKKYTLVAIVIPDDGETPAAATVVASGTSNTAYEKLEERVAALFLIYTVGDEASDTITITGLTAPQAGQSVDEWGDDNYPVFSPDYDFGGGGLLEGEYTTIEAFRAAINASGQFEGNFVPGRSYTLYLFIRSETPTLPLYATLNVPGATSATYEYFGEEDGRYYADIMIVYTVGGAEVENRVVGVSVPLAGDNAEDYAENIWSILSNTYAFSTECRVNDLSGEPFTGDFVAGTQYIVAVKYSFLYGAPDALNLTVDGADNVEYRRIDEYNGVIFITFTAKEFSGTVIESVDVTLPEIGADLIFGTPVMTDNENITATMTFFPIEGNVIPTRIEEGKIYGAYLFLEAKNGAALSFESIKLNGEELTEVADIDGVRYTGNGTVIMFVYAFGEVDTLNIGDVGLVDGEYLANGSNTPTTTKPATGGYAYWKDGVLTLHDFVYESNAEGDGFIYSLINDNIDIVLEGNNVINCPNYSEVISVYETLVIGGSGTLTLTGDEDAIDADDLIVNGGTITVNAYYDCVMLSSFTINGGTITLNADNEAIYSYNGITMTGGTLTVNAASESEYAIHAQKGVTISNATMTVNKTDNNLPIFIYQSGITINAGGTLNVNAPDLQGSLFGSSCYEVNVNGGTLNVTANNGCLYVINDIIFNGTVNITAASDYAVHSSRGNIYVNGGTVEIKNSAGRAFSSAPVIASGLSAKASTTVDGTMNPYVAGDNNTYKHVVIAAEAPAEAEIYVGGVGLVSGEYLANGSDTPVKDKPAGGYAYYKDGVLTLHDYSYTGAGDLYNNSLGESYAVIYFGGDALEIVLEGTSTIIANADDTFGLLFDAETDIKIGGSGSMNVVTQGFKYAIYCDTFLLESGGVRIGTPDETKTAKYLLRCNEMLISGGELTINTVGTAAVRMDGNATVNGGTLTVNSYYSCFYLTKKEYSLTINGGTVTLHSNGSCFYLNYKMDALTVNGGTVDIRSNTNFAIAYAPILGSGVSITASNETNGELGEYLAENIQQYKRLYITKSTIEDTFSVIVVNGTADITDAKVGDKITLSAGPAPDGKSFDKWIITDGEGFLLSDPRDPNATFRMVADHITVEATYKYVVSKIVATTDVSSILIFGEELKNPSFTITEGSPASYNNAGVLNWEMYDEATGNWIAMSFHRDHTVTEGKYRLVCRFGVYTDAYKTHTLAKDATVEINGVEWTVRAATEYADTYCAMIVVSPEFTVECVHAYDNACDPDCNYCGEQRTVSHDYSDATCTSKAKCSVCGDEKGELAPHTPGADDGDCTTAITCSACGTETTPAKASHTGGTATCTAKAKCSVCEAEYGELAEHKYSEATCTAKAKCSVCNEEKGDLAPHSYVEGKCSCGATDPNYQPPHEHNFVEGKCECGETDPNYQPPHEHNFVEGKCECGETDPNYTPETNDPGTDVPGTDTPGTDDPNTGNTDEPKDDEGGCGSSVGSGSVLVVGVGGFALVWFVIKKKTWAEFLAIFKKG